MLTARNITDFYVREVRPILGNSEVPIAERKNLVFRYVELRTGLVSKPIRDMQERERNLKALVNKLRGEGQEMSLGRQALKEIFDEIETEFFKNIEKDEELGMPCYSVERERIKYTYQRAVTKALSDYLDKIYVG